MLNRVQCSMVYIAPKINLNKSTFMIYFIKPNTKLTVITQFYIQNYSLFSAYLKKKNVYLWITLYYIFDELSALNSENVCSLKTVNNVKYSNEFLVFCRYMTED